MLTSMDRRSSEASPPKRLRWTGARHLEAIERHVSCEAGVPRLDAEGYAAELLSRTGIPARRWSQWVPWALTWATHPGLGPALDDGRVIELDGGLRIRMGDCPWALRCEAARVSLEDEGEHAPSPVLTAERVLAQVLEHAEGGPVAPSSLTAASIVQLADAVLRRYEAERSEEPEEADLDPLDAEHVRMVLAIHRSLGRARPSPPHVPTQGERPKPRWPPPIHRPAPVLMLPFAPIARVARILGGG